MSQQMILPKSLQNRRCYTMADPLLGKSTGENESSFRHLEQNLLLKSLMKGHALSTDAVSAISEATGIVIDASTPDAIGRQMVRVIETTKTSIQIRMPRYIRAAKSKRSKKGATGGTRNDYPIINVDQEVEASESWDRQYLEDSDFDVAAEEAAALGRNHDIYETTQIIDFFNKIPVAEIAGGAEVSAITSGTFVFDDILNLWNTVKRTDYTPDILCVHPDQLTDLMKEEEFRNQLQLGEFFNPASGQFGSLIMGLNILSSSLMTPGTVFCASSNQTVMYPLRRDKMLSSFQPANNTFEMQVTSRFGIDTGRAETMSRMIDA